MSSAVTTSSAVPGARAVILPELLTLATAGFLDSKNQPVVDVLDGSILTAFKEALSPTMSSKLAGFKEKEVTGISGVARGSVGSQV